MRVLIDTNIAIHLRDGDRYVKDRARIFDGPPAISIVTLVELESGVHAKAALADKRRRAVDALLCEITVHPFELPDARTYGRIVAAAGFSRRKVADRMIAATALVHGLTLVTLNATDFRDVPGLVIEDWAIA